MSGSRDLLGDRDVAPHSAVSMAIPVPESLIDVLTERAAAEAARRITASLELRQTPYLSVSEAAEYLRCSRQRIYDLASSGRLPRVKEGRRVLFHRRDLERLLTK